MHVMEKDEQLAIFFTLLVGVLLSTFLIGVLWRQCLQLLRRRRRHLGQDDSDDDDDDEDEAAVLLEDIRQLETKRRSSRELKDEVKSLRETQAQVRSFLESLQTKLQEKQASSKPLSGSRDKVE
jgi:DNA-directed RNA polymerase specialized sigma24 family protein